MAKSNRAFKSAKRGKELKRQKKQEEKRKRRLGLEDAEPEKDEDSTEDKPSEE